MEHLFIPYELAVTAKEKGFDEPCIGYFGINYLINKMALRLVDHQPIKPSKFKTELLGAPLYQQIIDWFREEKKIEITIFSPNPFIYGYSFEFLEAWCEEEKSTALHILDQLFYKEKTGKYKSVKEWKELKYTYYEALNEAIKEAFKLIEVNKEVVNG